VAIAPAADFQHIAEMNESVDKRLGPYVAMAYSRFYPEVNYEQALRQEARPALTTSFQGRALAMGTNPRLAARLRQNKADGAIAAPVVIAQGLTDVVVPPAATND